MLLYQLLKACGLGNSFLRLVSRMPETVQHRLGLVPIRVRCD